MMMLAASVVQVSGRVPLYSNAATVPLAVRLGVDEEGPGRNLKTGPGCGSLPLAAAARVARAALGQGHLSGSFKVIINDVARPKST